MMTKLASRICPMCKASLLKSNEEYDIADTLNKWELVISKNFTNDVHILSKMTPKVTLYNCPGCDLGIFLPIVVGNDSFYSQITQHNYYNVEKWEFKQALKETPTGKNLKLLDIGCGQGIFLDIVSTHRPKIDLYGYEFNSNASSVAKTKGYNILKDLDENLKFDIITAFQVLEHVSDPQSFLSKLRNLLSDTGILIITTPDSLGPLKNFSAALTEIPPHHVTRWSMPTYIKGISLSGLFIEKVLFEPLPDYLWHAYLPKVWDNIWPAKFMKKLIKKEKLRFDHKDHEICHFIDLQKDKKVTHLKGVPGHTIYGVFRKKRGIKFNFLKVKTYFKSLR